MNTARHVDELLAGWKQEGYSKPEIIVKLAQSCIGWPYVFGAWGEYCTPSKRKVYYGYHPEKENIITRCQILSNKKAVCDGCPYYPEDEESRMFDCRGFTYWLLFQVGIKISGSGATAQFNEASNWVIRGKISEMPANQICCVFKQDGTKMSHTGMHIGNGEIIHCSGTVKKGKTSDNGWTHYAVPIGIDVAEGIPIANSTISVGNEYPTLKRGSKGECVILAQTELIKRGYDLGTYGADGSFGQITDAAVRKFQADWGLQVDGIIGRKTWAYLNTPQEEKLVSLMIPGLTNSQATSLMSVYPKAYLVDAEEKAE